MLLATYHSGNWLQGIKRLFGNMLRVAVSYFAGIQNRLGFEHYLLRYMLISYISIHCMAI